MATSGEDAGAAEVRDEEWLISQARSYQKTDVYYAKSWLIVGRSLYPRNFSIQFEMYLLEKSSKNVKDAAKLFEEMAKAFPQESQLWLEIQSMSDALQSESGDENSAYLRELFAALPPTLQCSMLLRTADAAPDTLARCRLRMLVVDRYPDQVSDQGVKLVELLLQAEKVARCQTPVNCYRKYLAADVLPRLLRTGGVHVAMHRCFFAWLEKVIEFYVCYVTRQSTPDAAGSSVKVRTVTIDGLSEKESHITDPWNQLFQLLQLVAGQLQWKIGRLFQLDSCEAQFQQLSSVYESIRSLPPTDAATRSLHSQLFYSCVVVFLRSINNYMSAIQPAAGHDQPGFVMLEVCRIDSSGLAFDHRTKKLKVEPEIPAVIAPDSIPADVVSHFNTGFRCWQLLQAELLKPDFTRLCQQWTSDCWTMLRHFEIDACICQGFYQEALVKLQTVAVGTCALTQSYVQKRASLQTACCYYYLGNFAKSAQLILDILSSLTLTGDSATNYSNNDGCAKLTPPTAAGRQLHLVLCTDPNVLSYSIGILIACLKEKLFRLNVTDDLAIGHLIVLLQLQWPKYEVLFSEIIRMITKRGKFTYGLFFSYIININMLEEFAFLWTQGVILDILPSTAKGTALARTVTRGVNKGVKEDLKMSLEHQVSRSQENIVTLLRQFLLDEAELVKQSLVV